MGVYFVSPALSDCDQRADRDRAPRRGRSPPAMGCSSKRRPTTLASPHDIRGARRMLERPRLGGHGLRAGHQALGGALQFEQAGGAIALAVVDRGHQVRDLVGQPVAPLVNLPADFEEAERLAMLGVLERCCARCRAAATCASAPGRTRWDWRRARARRDRSRTRAPLPR